MRQLIIFGDSVIKGVHHCGGKFHLCPDHDFASLQAVGVEAHNYAKMGATIGTGLSILQRRLSACVPGATVLFSFGGNDCDYNWAEIAAAPEISPPVWTVSDEGVGMAVLVFTTGFSASENAVVSSEPSTKKARHSAPTRSGETVFFVPDDFSSEKE